MELGCTFKQLNQCLRIHCVDDLDKLKALLLESLALLKKTSTNNKCSALVGNILFIAYEMTK